MKVLAEIQEPAATRGRWVLMPRPDARFVGKGSRSRVRVRERRRRVLTVLGEAIGFTALIGAVPPLRPMWFVSGVFALLFLGYVLLLLRVRPARTSNQRARPVTLPDTDVAVLRAPSHRATRQPRKRAAAI
jgi:hypothetical protein